MRLHERQIIYVLFISYYIIWNIFRTSFPIIYLSIRQNSFVIRKFIKSCSMDPFSFLSSLNHCEEPQHASLHKKPILRPLFHSTFSDSNIHVNNFNEVVHLIQMLFTQTQNH
jgi:hypothetical protein